MACPPTLCLSPVKSSVPGGAMWFYLEFCTSCPVFVFKQDLLPVCVIRLHLVQYQPEPHHTATATPLLRAAHRGAVTLTFTQIRLRWELAAAARLFNFSSISSESP